ncbi:DUF427 domain-containing protein [Amycolatopsis umgeniensis]|uniref:Uncharacterized protein (DUF427 family) n=1 Tax=Amycolatopsis umgeniensis TaxID=336628 RepID=A0A841B1L2_9PSEU|nr:DUF427 domain-containing protein [Amycolatopsis umgeniensis]MBB5852208.1 uncharacterized protein (DUF427 family) [Amycolatopsis umgeniensis]
MSDKKVLKPSAAHPITVAPNAARVVVTVGGKVVADSANALTLREANYPPAQYIPRADVDFDLLERTEHSTYCPFKGDASYYSIRTGDGVAENAVWTYEAPHDAVAEIKDHVAFYPTKVDAIEER